MLIAIAQSAASIESDYEKASLLIKEQNVIRAISRRAWNGCMRSARLVQIMSTIAY